MTGALQTHARKYQIPIDTLNFSFSVLRIDDENEVEKTPDNGIYITGLFLDGARWNRIEHFLAIALPGFIFNDISHTKGLFDFCITYMLNMINKKKLTKSFNFAR